MRALLLLAVAGAVFAVGLGLAGYSVARDTIALPAVQLDGGKPLAPAPARAATPDRTTANRATTRTKEARPARTTTVATRAGSEGTPTTSETGEDSSGQGRGRNRGRGGDGSSSGSGSGDDDD